MRLTIDHVPLAKQRPRFSTYNGKARTYDVQSSAMKKLKFYFAKQMRDKGYLKAEEGPVIVNLTAHMPKPKSWSKKRLKEAEGQPVITKPDVDNIYKLYSDVLNGIAYRDDAQIFRNLSEKFYSDKPRIEIEIIPLGEFMVNEHAKTVQENISLEDLDYMIKKANKLGESGRKIQRVFAQEDAEGKHIYFEVQGLKQRVCW